MTDYGFNDEVSSWRNRNRLDAKWFFNVNDFNNPRAAFRCMNAGSSSSYVGFFDNDEASSLKIYSNNREC